MKKSYLTLGLLLVACFIAFAQEDNFREILKNCRDEGLKKGYFADRSDCYVGKMTPNFKAKILHGEEIELEKLRRQAVVLYFWYSSCGEPCNAQMPALSCKS